LALPWRHLVDFTPCPTAFERDSDAMLRAARFRFYEIRPPDVI
jgi:hypothetical protein